MNPVYVYRCNECDALDWEVRHKMSEDPEIRCDCGAIRHRVPQATGFVLKGAGFYVSRPGAGDPDKGIPPALPYEFGGDLNTRKK